MVEIRDVTDVSEKTTVTIERYVDIDKLPESSWVTAERPHPAFVPVRALLSVKIGTAGNGWAHGRLVEGSSDHPGAKVHAEVVDGRVDNLGYPLGFPDWLVPTVEQMVQTAAGHVRVIEHAC